LSFRRWSPIGALHWRSSTLPERVPYSRPHDSMSDSTWARSHTGSPTFTSLGWIVSGEPIDPDPVKALAIRLGAELRRRRRDANLPQRAIAARISYDRSYVSQVEAGRQIPAEHFVLLCDQALHSRGALRAIFRELLAEREARRQKAHAERWRAETGARLRPLDQASVVALPDPAALGLASPAGPPSDTGMERRPFFRLLGSASGVLLAETLGVELVDLARAMQASNVSGDTLDRMEAGVLRFHQVYAQVPPADLLPHVHEHLRATTELLQRSQPIKYRRRLCSIAGHLAGLRGWLTFDLGDQEGTHVWYEIALQPADEAEDLALCGWILGGRSLIPSYNSDPAGALDLIHRAQSYAGRSANTTARAWLAALEARAHAGLGQAAAFRHAQDLANDAIDDTRLDDRRHGMDFHHGRLNVAYYEGTSLVTLEQPQAARPILSVALAVQGPTHLKARSIVLLAQATTHVQEREIEEACAVAGKALDIPSEQRIGPIEQRARDLMRVLEPWHSEPAVVTLRDRLATP
jgi:transcriptional regulator with XRE-family HTH domain